MKQVAAHQQLVYVSQIDPMPRKMPSCLLDTKPCNVPADDYNVSAGNLNDHVREEIDGTGAKLNRTKAKEKEEG